MAYGARLESGLGASPQGFESPILRHCSRLTPSYPDFRPGSWFLGRSVEVTSKPVTLTLCGGDHPGEACICRVKQGLALGVVRRNRRRTMLPWGSTAPWHNLLRPRPGRSVS